jgi:hypothetical protein
MFALMEQDFSKLKNSPKFKQVSNLILYERKQNCRNFISIFILESYKPRNVILHTSRKTEKSKNETEDPNQDQGHGHVAMWLQL